MTTHLSEKYVVFKKEDFDAWAREDTSSKFATGIMLHDVFVLKATDVLAPACLHGYAHLARTMLELNESKDFLDPEEAQHLEQLADGATDLAIAWQRQVGRIPT